VFVPLFYFFATPTRLADGLGTKDYPRVHLTPRPRLVFNQTLVPPRRPTWTGFGDQLFNMKIIAVKITDFKDFRAFGTANVRKSFKYLARRLSGGGIELIQH
jgi:hypothetical protein